MHIFSPDVLTSMLDHKNENKIIISKIDTTSNYRMTIMVQ